jgi:hypothetical protein
MELPNCNSLSVCTEKYGVFIVHNAFKLSLEAADANRHSFLSELRRFRQIRFGISLKQEGKLFLFRSRIFRSVNERENLVRKLFF